MFARIIQESKELIMEIYGYALKIWVFNKKVNMWVVLNNMSNACTYLI